MTPEEIEKKKREEQEKKVSERIRKLETTELQNLTEHDFRYYPFGTTYSALGTNHPLPEQYMEPQNADTLLMLPSKEQLLQNLKSTKMQMRCVFFALFLIQPLVFLWGSLELWITYGILWAIALVLQWFFHEAVVKDFGSLGVAPLFGQAKANPMPWKMVRYLGLAYELVRDAPVKYRKFDLWRPGADASNPNSFLWVQERMRESGLIVLRHFRSVSERGTNADSQTQETRYNESMSTVQGAVNGLIHRMTWTANVYYWGTVFLAAPLGVLGLFSLAVKIAHAIIM